MKRLRITLMVILTALGLILMSSIDPNRARAHYVAPIMAQGSPTCAASPSGMVSWWPGDGDANDIQAGNNGTLQGGTTFVPGMVNQAFTFNGTDAYIRVRDNANLYPGAGAFTVDAWIRTTQMSSNNPMILAHYECANACPSGAANSVYDLYINGNGKLNGFLRDTAGISQTITSAKVVADGVYHHIALVRDTTGLQMYLYVDGIVDASAPLTVTGTIKDDDGEADPFTIGALIQGGTNSPDQLFAGQVDEVEYINRALSQSEIQSIVNASSAGHCRPTCTPPPAGLVSWWPSDGSANDIQGGNNGTLINGAQFDSGRVNQGFSFNGSSFVSVPDSTGLKPQVLTLDAWIKTSGLGGGPATFIASKSGNADAQGYEFGLYPTGRLRFTLNNALGGADLVGSTIVTDNVFHHAAATYDGETMRIYVDGQLDAQKAIATTIVYPAGTPFLIGGREYSFIPGHWYGTIDELEFFNRALSQSEIQSIVNAGSAGKCRKCSSPPPGMAAWWTGDGNANDIQGSNNGTLVNGATFAPGMVGQAFRLDGVDDFVQVPDSSSVSITGAISMDAWIKPNSISGLFQAIIAKYNSTCPVPGTDDNSHALEVLDDGKLRFGVFRADGNYRAVDTANPVISSDVFTHVAATFNPLAQSMKIYVNGVDVATTLVGGSVNVDAIADNNTPVTIGRFFCASGNANPFGGLIDEVELFNRALSSSEIQAIYNAGSAGKCKTPANRPAEAHCQNVTVSADTSCAADASIDNGSFDPDSGDTITLAQSPPGPYPLGVTVVTLTVTDNNGASSTCTATVTVADTTPSAITCPDNIIATAATGHCSAAVDYTAPTATDNCGSAAVSCTPESGSTFLKGTTTVTCTATDTSNNRSTCSFTVTVNNDENPTVICPADVSTSNDAGQCGAVVSYPAPTASSICSDVTAGCSPPSGSFFTIGATNVLCTATDFSGRTATCTFKVTVTDTQPPTITCPADVTKPNDHDQCGAVISYDSPTAADNCPGVNSNCSPPSGSQFPVGATTVTCTATDSANNRSSCSFTVTVNDVQPPVITCVSSIVVGTDPNSGTATVTYQSTVRDNCPGAISSCTPASGSHFALGATTVTCTATDAANNQASCGFTVTVTDNQPPTIMCSTGIARPNDLNLCGALVTYSNPTVTDNSPGARFSCAPPAGAFFPVGVTAVTCTATDSGDNHSTCSFAVTVRDTQAPVINCPANVTNLNTAGLCSASVNPGLATATDNCPGVTVAGVRSDGLGLNAAYPVGTTTIIWTARDAAIPANLASCTQTIVVNDTQAPTITMRAGQQIEFWSPNHQYQTVNVSDFVASAGDICSGDLTGNAVIASITSDEPDDAAGDGDGNTINDIVIAPNCKTAQLRAERQGSGDGRVYTITFRVRDGAGNVKTATAKVGVPRSQGNNNAPIDSGPDHTVNSSCP